MSVIRACIVLFAFVEAAWMTFDGSRAFIKGDYVTPSSGSHAGQLGPWSRIVEAAGLNPRSVPMKAVFVVYGTVWLFVIAAYSRGVPWAPRAMLIAAVGSLWYLPIGTLCSAIVIAGLLRMGR